MLPSPTPLRAAPRAPQPSSALFVIAAGVCAALHVGKLPPAIGALQLSLGLTLVEAGFLLSLVQFAGMVSAVAIGAWIDGFGAVRSMVCGLALLAVASLAGGAADRPAVLLLFRALEGFGFLLTVLPGPGLVRRLVPPERVNRVLGLWGVYMPLGVALALLAGPLWIEAFGWRSWWWLNGALSGAMALVLLRRVPEVRSPPSAGSAAGWRSRLTVTLRSAGPWGVAWTFAVYSSQWLAVIAFLPTVYEEAGVPVGWRAVLTALVALVNLVGNVLSGRLLQRGHRASRLMGAAFVTMAGCTVLAFADLPIDTAGRFAAVLVFSLVGGLIPTALFSTALAVAPGDAAVSTTIGWMQQWSALGQFAGPPAVAWLASETGGWHWTWAATGAASLTGLLITGAMARRYRV